MIGQKDLSKEIVQKLRLKNVNTMLNRIVCINYFIPSSPIINFISYNYFLKLYAEPIKERHAASLQYVYCQGKDTICTMCEILNGNN